VFVPYAEMLGDAFCKGLVVDVNKEDKQLILDDEKKVRCHERFVNFAPSRLYESEEAPFYEKN